MLSNAKSFRQRLISEKLSLARNRARASGEMELGKSEENKLYEVASIRKLKIQFDGWWTRTEFGRNYGKDFRTLTYKDVEDLIYLSRAKGKAKRRVVAITHIIRAVRMFKHISENYGEEESRNEELALTLRKVLDVLNETKGSRGNKSRESLEKQLKKIKSAIDELGTRQGLLTGKIAKERCKATLYKLEEALSSGNIDFVKAQASALLVSVINRLEKWRKKEVEEVSLLNLQREFICRKKRDEWLVSQLAKWYEETEAIWRYILHDRTRLFVLDSMLSELKQKKFKTLELLAEENSKVFRIDDLDDKDAHKKVLMSYLGNEGGYGKGKDTLIGHLRLLYLAAKRRDGNAALNEIEFMKVFVLANKPEFVAKELGKDPEYWEEAVQMLEEAHSLLMEEDLEGARKLFGEAYRFGCGVVGIELP